MHGRFDAPISATCGSGSARLHVGAGLGPMTPLIVSLRMRMREGGDYLSPAPSSDAHAIVGRGLGDLILKAMLKGTVL